MNTKKEIDEYFTKNYKDIVNYSKNLLFKYKKKDDPYAFVSQCYTYLIEIEPFDGKIKTYIGTWLRNNAYWSNGYTEQLKNQYKRKVDVNDIIIENIPEELYDKEDFDYRIFLLSYYDSLVSLELRATFEIFFIEKKTSHRAFAEYIGLSRSVASKFIKNMMNDLKNYYDCYEQKT